MLIDSKIINSHLSINNCKNEDSINFIRVEGSKNKVNVKNAKYDGVDLDFSKIFFDKINIQNSGNDCLDVSGGVYNIKFFYGSNCNDKGISVGENSRISAKNINISNSNFGVVCKDLSQLLIEKSSFNNVNMGFIAFQKKPEFGPANIIANDVIITKSNKPFNIEINSTLIFDGQKVQNFEKDIKTLLYK